MSIENYDQAVSFLFQRLNYERVQQGEFKRSDLKLERMRQLLHVFGDPHENIPTIHVAGTKGKGSTCLMVESALRANGYNVGLFTSPHIAQFEERLTVNGQLPSQSRIVELTNFVRQKIQSAAPALETEATFFEMINTLAWVHFQKEQVDVVVLEVGMGGLYDTTNVCSPTVTAITEIGLDHVEILGKTIEKIAEQKGGIIKPAVPVVIGTQNQIAQNVLKEIAHRNDAPAYILGEQIQIIPEITPKTASKSDSESRNKNYGDLSKRDFLIGGEKQTGVPISAVGEHQVQNTAVALGILSVLAEQGIALSWENICNGLKTVKLPLRIETVQRNPKVILDAAHNLISIQSLIAAIQHDLPRYSDRVLVLGCSKNKDASEIAKRLASYFETVIVTPYLNNPRTQPVEVMKQVAIDAGFKTVLSCSTPQDAVEKAISLATRDGIVCVTGSFFLAAEAKETFL